MINVVNKVDCCGCEACCNICPQKCIDMIPDEEGFLYLKVNYKSCTNCGLCETVCPIANPAPRQKNGEQEAYLLQHKEDEICRQSTAGGAFTGIASHVIEHGGIVFGVEMTEDYHVRHGAAETVEELKRFRNSKYVQSRVGFTYQWVKRELQTGRMVCFSGTPCQVEGLRHYLGEEYDNLILVDVVCRAVPSPEVWKKYIRYEASQKGEFSSIRFRDKTLGYQYSTMELKGRNGKADRGGIESQPWLRMFFSGMIIRPSCTDCRFRCRYRNSDFTIWDCFDSGKFDKKLDERRGTTRVLVHTGKGKAVLEDVKKYYIWKKINSDDAVEDVEEMKESPRKNPQSERFYSDLNKMKIEDVIDKYFPTTGIVSAKRTIRILLNRLRLDGTIKHLLKK